MAETSARTPSPRFVEREALRVELLMGQRDCGEQVVAAREVLVHGGAVDACPFGDGGMSHGFRAPRHDRNALRSQRSESAGALLGSGSLRPPRRDRRSVQTLASWNRTTKSDHAAHSVMDLTA